MSATWKIMISGVREGQKGSYAYVCEVEGGKIVGAEEFVEEGERERVDGVILCNLSTHARVIHCLQELHT